jgi:carbon starvation protein CstA
MLPVRWKIFRLANYLQMIAALVLLGLFGYTYLSFTRGEGFGYFLLFCLVFVIVIVNNCVNVHIVHHYYPDKSLPAGKKVMSMILLIFYILIIIGLVLLAIFAISEMSDDDYRTGRDDWFGLSILAFHIVLGIYILILQMGLPRVLERNDRQHIEHLLDDLGNV